MDGHAGEGGHLKCKVDPNQTQSQDQAVTSMCTRNTIFFSTTS